MKVNPHIYLFLLINDLHIIMCIHIIIRRTLKSQENKKNLYYNALTSPKPQTYIEKAPICSKTDFGPAEAAGRSQTRPVEDFETDGGV